MVPAVRANHPSMGPTIFPLNRIELGDIWYGKAKLSAWEIKLLPGGWTSAFQRFSTLIRYPVEFLSPTLEALHQQTFLDKTPLSWTQWSNLCKNTSPKLHAVADCRVCGTPRYLSMRLLNEVNRTLDTFQCRSVGARCGEESIGKRIFDTYQEFPLVDAAKAALSTPITTPTSPSNTALEKPERTSFRTALSKDKSGIARGVTDKSFGILPHMTETADPIRRTIPPLPQDTLVDDWEYCTWADIKNKRIRHRRKRRDTDTESSSSEDERDTLNDTLATPHPKNFLHGTLAKRLRKPDPTLRQLNEYRLLKGTKEWRDTKYTFIKWINTNKELRFAGTPSVAHFVEWNRTMRTHFKDCDIHNTICQFEVATTTFTRNARSWWDAHCVKRPGLLVTYEQLLEWIRHELVPDSNPALAYMEWNTLKYRGNVEEYMKQIERLMEYFPIQRDTMIACLAKPISTEFAAELRNMDIRLEGMSNPKLKEVIKNHLISTRTHQSYRPPNHDRSHSAIRPRPATVPLDPHSPRHPPSRSYQGPFTSITSPHSPYQRHSPARQTFPAPSSRPRSHLCCCEVWRWSHPLLCVWKWKTWLDRVPEEEEGEMWCVWLRGTLDSILPTTLPTRTSGTPELSDHLP